MGKKVQKFFYGFKNLVKLGVEITDFKMTMGRTVFSFSCKTSVFDRLDALFGQFYVNVFGIFLKCARLPRWREREARERKPATQTPSVRQPETPSLCRSLLPASYSSGF